MLPKSILYYGTQESPPKPLPLRAGPLSLIFEPATGFLRHIRLGDREVVRAIYGAVRDQNWATIPPKLSGLNSEVAPDSFRLSFDVSCKEGIADFLWHGLITGEASGRISYDFHGQARSQFLRNRIGLCVLHPITECAGRACVIQHSDGRQEPGTFPKLVSPHQPFLDIKRFSWEVADAGVTAELDFAGEVFETEDQRNWTDASYKTYSTPLSLPHPVPVDTGTKVDQSVTLSLAGLIQPAALETRGGSPEVFFDTGTRLPLPPLGHCVASHGRPLSSREIQRLRGLRPAHLRVDLELSAPGYGAALERAVVEARHLNAQLYVALILERVRNRN